VGHAVPIAKNLFAIRANTQSKNCTAGLTKTVAGAQRHTTATTKSKLPFEMDGSATCVEGLFLHIFGDCQIQKHQTLTTSFLFPLEEKILRTMFG
jgi:hypothetical protein